MLNESEKEKLRTLTVETLLELRGAYLGTSHCNVLKHWDQIQDRMRIAARTTSSAEEWATSVQRALRLSSPSPRLSDSIMTLANEVRERRCASEWLQLVEDEYGFLMAMARSIAEQRKEARQHV